MICKRILKSQAGFTLTEMMITAAIVSILLVAFSAWLFQNAKQTKDLTNVQSYGQLVGGIKDASGQAEAVSKSEGAQFQDYGMTPPPP